MSYRSYVVKNILLCGACFTEPVKLKKKPAEQSAGRKGSRNSDT
jgi:hypothetical protein